MSIKKISWLKGYDDAESFASTRIRLFYPHNTINEFHRDKYVSVIGFDKNADILIVQKLIKNENIELIKNFKGIVIYDFDDDIGYSEITKILPYVDLVITDTIPKKQKFDTLFNDIECKVLEDCIDYGIISLNKPPYVSNKICWFGNWPNYSSIQRMIPDIVASDFELSIITDIKSFKFYLHPSIKKIQWNLETFIEDLRNSNICLLSHYGPDSIFKSNNKMIVAIASGLPCIVNSSKSYESLAKEFGLDYCIVNDGNSLKDTMDYFNDIENRKKYLKDIQPYILNNLSSRAITKKLIKMIEA